MKNSTQNDKTAIFVKGKTLKNTSSTDNARLVFLVKSNMNVLAAFKMIQKRINFVKRSNRSIKKSYVIKGMGKNIQTTLKIGAMIMEEMEEDIKENIKVYTRQVTVYNKLLAVKENVSTDDFSDAEDDKNNAAVTEVQAKKVPGVEIHIPLSSSYL